MAIVSVATEPPIASEINPAAIEAAPVTAPAVEVSCASMSRPPTVSALDSTNAEVVVSIVLAATAPPPLTATIPAENVAATDVAVIDASSLASIVVAPLVITSASAIEAWTRLSTPSTASDAPIAWPAPRPIVAASEAAPTKAVIADVSVAARSIAPALTPLDPLPDTVASVSTAIMFVASAPAPDTLSPPNAMVTTTAAAATSALIVELSLAVSLKLPPAEMLVPVEYASTWSGSQTPRPV